MSKTEYKSTNQLMRHLRDNGIDISGKLQKQQLINTGYFHGDFLANHITRFRSFHIKK